MIIRSPRNVTIITTTFLRDKNLSLKAKGLMAYMLSMPDNAEFSVDALVSGVAEGRECVRFAICELERQGYLVRRQTRTGGMFGEANYILYEEPNPPSSENPTSVPRERESPPSPPPREEREERKLPPTPPIKREEKEGIPPTLFSERERETPPTNARARAFEKPTTEMVDAYIKEKGFTFTADAFIDYYESTGWVVGKKPMKDWKAACRTWQRNEDKYSPLSGKKREDPPAKREEKNKWHEAKLKGWNV